MNTVTSQCPFSLPIVNGPNREQLMDTFRMQYLEDDVRPCVELKLSRDFVGDSHDALHGAILRVETRVEFRPLLLQYEDGSGQSFNIGGHVSMNGREGKSYVYMEGYYNTHTRRGAIRPVNNTDYNNSRLKRYLNASFLAKAEEWEKNHR